MRKFTLVLMGVLLLSSWAVPAQAKEVESATFCGKSGCVKSEDSKTLMAFQNNDGMPQDPPSAQAFYTVKLEISEGKGQTFNWWMNYAPKARLIRTANESGATWFTISMWNKQIPGLLKDVEPYPATAFAFMTQSDPGPLKYTQKDLIAAKKAAAAAAVDTDSQPASDPVAKVDPQPVSAPQPSDGNSLVPILVILGLAAVAAVAVGVQRRRAGDAVTGS